MVDEMVLQGRDLTRSDWRETEYFRRNCVVEYTDKVATSFDRWIVGLGYVHEGALYCVMGDNTDHTVAMFGYGGSSSAAFGYLFNLPFPYICRIVDMNYTNITIAALSDVQGMSTAPPDGNRHRQPSSAQLTEAGIGWEDTESRFVTESYGMKKMVLRKIYAAKAALSAIPVSIPVFPLRKPR